MFAVVVCKCVYSLSAEFASSCECQSASEALCVLTCRCVGPTMFQNSMLSRHVPCLIRIPYHEWIDKGEHLAHMYLQDKLRLEGHCSLPDFVSPD